MTLPPEWKQLIVEYLGTKEARELHMRVSSEYENFAICPPKDKVFSAFYNCPPNKVSVVILGQDPYFNSGQANGMSFSINPESKCTFPPTLSNIIKEVRSECGTCAVENGDLTQWARQGVLLLNTSLTVRQGIPLSHANIGWDGFTRAILAALNKSKAQGECGGGDGIVFILWGSHAQKYRDILTNPKNLVLVSPHPSPLSASRGFFGCNHFIKTNEFLKKVGKPTIQW